MAELQQPNIVGNFLAAYSSGLERQQQQQDAAYQRQRQAKADDRLDQQFQWQMDDRQIAAANDRANKIARVALISDTPEKWAMNVPVLMQQLGIDGPAPDFSTREAKIAEAQSLQEMLKAQMDEREAARLDRVANANIAQSYAAARASNRQGQGGGGLGNAPSGYQWVRNADGTLSQAPIKGGPADPNRGLIGKPLTSAIEKEITNVGEKLSDLRQFNTTFDDQFAERGLLGMGGDLRNLYDRTIGDGSAAANWWQQYDRYKNMVRNELFGASLTVGETQNFEKSDINPNMNPETIRANLKRQQDVLERAAARRAQSLKLQGYNPRAIDVTLGTAPDGSGTNWTYDAQGNLVQAK
jgi:hypothetical protein